MRLISTCHKGLTVFKNTVEIDYAAAGPGLIALVGDNGAGKTTCMEAAPASLFKRMPTRPGSLYDHCSGSDCFVESLWDDDGREIRVRLVIDAERRKTEGYVYVNGEPWSSGKSRSFDDAIRTLFGSEGLFLSSVFASQDKSGSFLGMKKGDRKSLFAELLGLGTLETLAERSRAEATQAAGDVEKHRAVLQAVEGDGESVEDLAERLTDAEHNLRVSRNAHESAAATEFFTGEAVEAARSAAGKLQAATDAATAADRGLIMAREAQQEATARPERIRSDAERLRQGIGARRTVIAQRQARDRCLSATKTIDARRAELKQQIGDLPDAAECESILVAMRAERQKMEANQEHNKRAAELQRRGNLIYNVPCDANAEPYSGCPLLADAMNAREELRGLMDNHMFSPTLDASTLQTIATEFDTAQRDLARAWSAENLHTELGGLDQRQAEAERQRDTEIADVRTKLAAEAEDLAKIDAEENREHAEADQRIVEVSERLILAEQAVEDAEHAVAAIGAAPALDAALAVRQDAATARNQADAALRRSQQAVDQIGMRIDEAKAREAKAAEARQATEAALEHLGDWRLLAEAAGKDGVQALEIAAAAPEISGIANELLQACYGPRFSLTLETLAAKRSGGMREAFDLIVYDGKHPRNAANLSGGERVIVEMALRLSLAIFNAKKNSIRYRTMWLDEMASALDPENAAAFMLMLRRAMALGSFHQVIFVAHLPAVFEAADVRLYVADGAVRVEGAEVAA